MPPSGPNQPQIPTQARERNILAMSTKTIFIKILTPNCKTTTRFKERTNSNFKRRANKAIKWLSVHRLETATGAALPSKKMLTTWPKEIHLLSSEDASVKNSKIFLSALITRRSTIQIPSTRMAKTCSTRLSKHQLIALQEKIVTRRQISTGQWSLSRTNLRIGSQIHSCSICALLETCKALWLRVSLIFSTNLGN